jgi:hypothetical protein
MDILVGSELIWDNPPGVYQDEPTRNGVLHNMSAALQWAGFRVGFFSVDGGLK